MKRLCSQCGRHRSRFRDSKRRYMRADKHHPLCPRCYQAESQRMSQRQQYER